MESLIVPVILAGGQGTRLWPMSRTARPKQFLPLTGPQSLFQKTLQRVADPEIYWPPIIVAKVDYRFLVAEQAAECGVGAGSIVLEPVARNTAAAITAAAVQAHQQFGRDVVLHILPSDHDVETSDDYFQAVASAVESAQDGHLVAFGLKPRSPESGFGYFKCPAEPGRPAQPIAHFVEKPDQARAAKMLEEGGYYWNSGMFVMRADTFLSECETLAPQTYSAALAAVQDAVGDLDFLRLDHTAYAAAPDISVDYAIFEKTKKSKAVAADFPWSDLGSWDAVWKAVSPDDQGNVSQGPVSLHGVSNSLVISEHAHVAVNGMDDLAVIATGDAVYVGRLSGAQSVGTVVNLLRSDEKTSGLTEAHRTTYRPWGGYCSVVSGDRFQVKRLFVKPGKRLSLQKHHHRSEHWIVVRGTAEVTVEGTVTMLSENQSVFLPIGCIHRLANPGKIELELIEVQTGPYLGEDDIIRIEDEFGRV